jgi:hypothetical protein
LLEVPPTEIRFVIDANASEGCANVTVLAAVAVHLSDINASTPPTQDAAGACNGVSATFVIGGIAE